MCSSLSQYSFFTLKHHSLALQGERKEEKMKTSFFFSLDCTPLALRNPIAKTV